MRSVVQIFILIAVFVSGCSTYTSRTSAMRTMWLRGNTPASEKLAEAVADDSDNTDALIWSLEQGAVYRANANFAKSIASFEKAHTLIEKFDSQPDTKISEETAAFFANQTYMSYRGYHYDRIMLCVYQALNFIETKNFERATVEIRRLQNFQDDAKHKNLSRIETKERALQRAKNADKKLTKANISNSVIDAKLKSIYGGVYNNSSALQQAKSLYVNPFGYWLSGIYFANRAQSQSDKEQGAALLRICAEMLGGKSSFVSADAMSAEMSADGKSDSFGNITYVVFETGIAPIRKQIRLDLPIYIFSGNAPHIAVNFPYLSPQQSFRKSIRIRADDKDIGLETISDMDEIISEEFNIELPYVITRTLLSAASKATAEYFAARAVGDYGFLVHAASGIYQSAFNNADLRTWQTLPKQIKIARINTPKNCKIFVENTPVSVSSKGVNIIYVKSMSASGNVIMRTFNFLDNKN